MVTQLLKKCAILSLLSSLFLPLVAYAGGVGLGATRVIYPSENKQVSLSVRNSDEKGFFLIQSWVEDNHGKKVNDFVITPPLFMIKPMSENSLRITYTGKTLPTDKESAYRIVVKAIPSKDKKTDNVNESSLQIAVASRIKLFYRPSNLTMNVDDAQQKLLVEQRGKELVLNNPTPYFITLSKVSVGGKLLPNVMVEPGGEMKMPIPAGAVGNISYSTINDFGGLTVGRK